MQSQGQTMSTGLDQGAQFDADQEVSKVFG